MKDPDSEENDEFWSALVGIIIAANVAWYASKSIALLSTIVMVPPGFAEAIWNIAVVALLIAAGGTAISVAGTMR